MRAVPLTFAASASNATLPDQALVRHRRSAHGPAPKNMGRVAHWVSAGHGFATPTAGRTLGSNTNSSCRPWRSAGLGEQRRRPRQARSCGATQSGLLEMTSWEESRSICHSAGGRRENRPFQVEPPAVGQRCCSLALASAISICSFLPCASFVSWAGVSSVSRSAFCI